MTTFNPAADIRSNPNLGSPALNRNVLNVEHKFKMHMNSVMIVIMRKNMEENLKNTIAKNVIKK